MNAVVRTAPGHARCHLPSANGYIPRDDARPDRDLPDRFLTADHARLEALLARAARADGSIDAGVYAEFRQGTLLPYARTKRGGQHLPIAATLRKDHGEIAALLVPSPTPAICAQLRAVLARHNLREEGAAGLYATCDDLAGDEAVQVVERLKAQPSVPMAPHYDGPIVSKHRR